MTFVALVLVLRQLVGKPLNRFHVLMLQMFAIGGFETMMFSLVPFLLSFSGVPLTDVWRISSGAFAPIMLVTNIWYYRRRRVVAPDRKHHVGTYLSMVIPALAVSVMTLHAFGVIYAESIAPFAIGLVSCFIPVAAGFLTTIQDFLSSEEWAVRIGTGSRELGLGPAGSRDSSVGSRFGEARNCPRLPLRFSPRVGMVTIADPGIPAALGLL